jgi:eukaryotic-like serine/threonine-protein kinase
MSASPHAAPENCPDENVLAAFASGTLTGPGASSVEAHLDGCADCRALIAAVAAERSTPDSASVESRLDRRAPGAAPTGGAEPLRSGDALGRYVISGVLGSGGMGVVYAAEDPRLGRRVALKLLHPALAEAAEEQQRRLLREAQAMARLSHPNVLPVFDLGMEGGQVFLAMELIEGPTLAEWLRQRERTWQEILGLFVEAGRGLAAAHQAGLVHRDFKPANVLVGTDGRPRVTDFGLVRVGASSEEGPAQADPRAAESPLTQTGTVAGTPAYMSPEQLAGRRVDARGDQFSFCVALYEALQGVRPFAADAPAEHRWTLRRPERSPRLPGYVRAVLARGLALEPEERFPSMDALLEALTMRPPRSRRRWMALGLAGSLALAGMGVGIFRAVQSASTQLGEGAHISLAVGEQRELRVENLVRVALGSTEIVDVKVQDDGVLRFTGLSTGTTMLMVWQKDGDRQAYTVTVGP